MNSFFSQLHKDAGEIRLARAERDALRARLEAHMRAHPASARAMPSPYFLYLAPRRLVPVLVLALVFAGGGSAYAAQGALPGDLLYPVKVSVNEPLQIALAFTSQGKARAHAAIAERRLVEAETLVARDALTPIAKAEIEYNFEAHANAVQTIVQTEMVADPVEATDISAHFSSDVAAHAAIVAALGGKSASEETRRESDRLAAAVARRGGRVARADKAVSAGPAEASATVMTMAAVAPKAAPAKSDTETAVAARLTENVRQTLEKDRARLDAMSELDATTTAAVRAKIRRIERSLVDIESKTGDRHAVSEAEAALRDSIRIRTFLDAHARFETKVAPALLNALQRDLGEHRESAEGEDR